jgi:multimeric flavodoxin WrbA
MIYIKILGISSSLRAGSNTSILVNDALKGASTIDGVETKFISLRGKDIKPCVTACDRCNVEETYCVQKDDMQEIYEALIWADGMILGTPVYSQTLNAQMKIMMERCKPLERLELLRLKISGAIAVATGRNQGQEYAIHAIQNFFISNMMLTVGGIRSAVGVSGVASQESTIHKDIFQHGDFGRISAEENAFLLGKYVTTWTKVFKEGSSIIDPKNLFSGNEN